MVTIFLGELIMFSLLSKFSTLLLVATSFVLSAPSAFSEVTSREELERKRLCFPVLGEPCEETVLTRQSGTRSRIVINGPDQTSAFSEDAWSEVEFSMIASLAIIQCDGFGDYRVIQERTAIVCHSHPNAPGIVFYSEPQAGTNCRVELAERHARRHIEDALEQGYGASKDVGDIDRQFFSSAPVRLAADELRGWEQLDALRSVAGGAPDDMSWNYATAFSLWEFGGWHGTALASFHFKFENSNGTLINDATGDLAGTRNWTPTRIVELGLQDIGYWDTVFSQYRSTLAGYVFVDVTEDTDKCSRKYLR